MRYALIVAAIVVLLVVASSRSSASVDYFSEAARRFGVRESLLKAIAHVESNFNVNARGSSGEVGMFQMKRAAFDDAKSFGGLSGTYPDTLFDARMSALYAAAYLAWIRAQGMTSDYDMLRAYNRGVSIARRDRSAGALYAERVLEKERLYA